MGATSEVSAAADRSTAGVDTAASTIAPADDTTCPVAPGGIEGRQYWNVFARRFIFAPVFDLPSVSGAASYRFSIQSSDGAVRTFDAPKPQAALSPVWAQVPEGPTTVRVEGLDAAGKPVGVSGERTFYRSPGFSGQAETPVRPYSDGARDALRAIYLAPHVQNWLTTNTLDRTYSLYHFPNKVVGGLLRAMSSYSRVAESDAERKNAVEIGERAADWLLAHRTPADSRYAMFPPTYTLDVDKPFKGSADRVPKHWLMVPSAVDAALGFLDVYDVSHDKKYFEAARLIADTYVKTQEADGTWPLMINWQTGQPVADQRLVPTWVIDLFDRMERQYQAVNYRDARQKAWAWIERNPLSTWQWDGQFEDVKLVEPFKNLSREQACDVAVMLFEETKADPKRVALAEDLVRYAEDQFVVWYPIRDPKGWETATKRGSAASVFITPAVLEQYGCYVPVARSAAVQANTFLAAYAATHKPVYLEKAKAMANGLLKGQAWAAKSKNANGEIPTWEMTDRYANWLNNSFYAAEAVRKVGDATRAADANAAR